LREREAEFEMKNNKNLFTAILNALRNNKKLLIVLFLVLLFVVDRYVFTPAKLKGTWEFQIGHYIRDPIVYKQHFELSSDTIYFTTGEKCLLIGCYFDQLFMYDIDHKVITRYNRY
jgi:hypothetical protein